MAETPARDAAAAPRRMRPVSFTAVELTDRFWAPRQRAVAERTVPTLYARCEEAGMIEALDVAVPPPPLRIPIGEWGGTTQMFWDSDLGKWIEVASYTLATRRDAKIEALIDDIAARLAKAQRPDGYLNTYFIARAPEKRWTNLRDWHELYCCGHLIEGAVAYFEATGKRALLDVMCRYVDHIDGVFGPKPGQKRGYCGHPEIELALMKLFHATGEARYRDLARYFVDERGRQPHYYDIEARARGQDPKDYFFGTYEYCQAHKPVREQEKVVGHAVRAMYLYCAMADLAAEYGDDSLREACERLWDDLTSKRLYVTGGMGPSKDNEGFTRDYDLPNASAYAETCASVGLIFWAHRMLQLAPDGRYADMMERALYNGAISGLSLGGDRFFYENPLASHGDHHRWEWHRCPCCPPNIGRLVASIGQYVYSAGADEIAVHLYAAGSARIDLGGRTVTLRQETDYPWSGAVAIHVETGGPVRFALSLRMPGWCRKGGVAVNGAAAGDLESARRGYVRIDREWRDGDVVALDLAMPVERVYAHPDVADDAGRVALQRGPILYCLESVDHDVPVHRIALPRDARLALREAPDLLGGVVVLEGSGTASTAAGWGQMLYASHPSPVEACRINAVPYCVWDHRAPGEMEVWLRES